MKGLSAKQQGILKFMRRLHRRARLPAQHPRHPGRLRHQLHLRRRLQPQGARAPGPHPPRPRGLPRHRAARPAARAGARTVAVPIIGTIAAGQPIPVPRRHLDNVDYDNVFDATEDMTRGKENVFALKVRGTSMIDALVNDGDIVILEQTSSCDDGDMVAAWLKNENEATLKKFYREGDRVRLQPANSTMKPIFTDARQRRDPGQGARHHRPARLTPSPERRDSGGPMGRRSPSRAAHALDGDHRRPPRPPSQLLRPPDTPPTPTTPAPAPASRTPAPPPAPAGGRPPARPCVRPAPGTARRTPPPSAPPASRYSAISSPFVVSISTITYAAIALLLLRRCPSVHHIRSRKRKAGSAESAAPSAGGLRGVSPGSYCRSRAEQPKGMRSPSRPPHQPAGSTTTPASEAHSLPCR